MGHDEVLDFTGGDDSQDLVIRRFFDEV